MAALRGLGAQRQRAGLAGVLAERDFGRDAAEARATLRSSTVSDAAANDANQAGTGVSVLG
jgi:hypothetical protein